MEKKSLKSQFFENKQCEYYPCHKGLKEINCLFCYCPLFSFCIYRDKVGCEKCVSPHKKENYNIIIEELKKRYGNQT